MLGSLDGVIRVPIKFGTSFFRQWLEFIHPLHHMTPRKMDVLAAFLNNRHELSKVITDPNLLEKVALNSDSRKHVIDECGITNNYMQVIMDRFKRDGVIVDGRINPKYIPNVKEDESSFKLLLYFDLKK